MESSGPVSLQRSRKGGIAGAEIDAIGIDTTSCSVVALDVHGRPLRTAIIWMDVRAVREAEFILATGDPALVVNGGGSSPIRPNGCCRRPCGSSDINRIC